MFDDLIESKQRHERSAWQTAGSGIIHFLLIAGAARVTQSAAQALTPSDVPAAVFLRPPPPPEAPVPPRQAVVESSRLPPRGFQVLVPPRDIPLTIPPVSLDPDFRADNYLGRGVPGGTIDGLISGATALSEVIGTHAYQANEVDDPVRIIQSPVPVYPGALRAAGIEGSVTLEFVVGTDGRAEVATLRIVSSTNERFNESALATIRAAVFAPARTRGIAVRQLVQQAIRFRMGGAG